MNTKLRKSYFSEHERMFGVRIGVETRLTHEELFTRGTFVALAAYWR